MKKLQALAPLIISAILLTACGKSDPGVESGPDIPKSMNLSGTWQLTLPAGFQHKVAISFEGANRYRLSNPGLNMNGIYEIRGDRLVMAVPSDPRLTEFVWQIDDADHLTLVEEPPVGKTGANYRTATLKRLK